MLAAAAALFARQGYSATTMADVATAGGVSKGTLYHYVRDKQDLLAQISQAHVHRLQHLVQSVTDQQLPPQQHMAQLVLRFMQAYEHAQAEHRVLTEDVKFLPETPRETVLQAQRQVVQAFADAVSRVRPEVQVAGQHKAVAMLLFGMMNWTFTWLRAEGPLRHQDVAQLVLALFTGGLQALPVQHSEACAAASASCAVAAEPPRRAAVAAGACRPAAPG